MVFARGTDGRRAPLEGGGARRHRATSIAVALLTLAARAVSQEAEGEWCVTDEGYDGICRHLRHCPYLQRQTSVFNGAGANIPNLCSYGSGGAIVCCPTAPPTDTSKPVVPNVPPPPSSKPQAHHPPSSRPPSPRPPSPRPPSPRPPLPHPKQPEDTVVITLPKDSTSVRISERKCHEYMNSLDEETTQLRTGFLSDVWCPYPPPGNELIVGGVTAFSGEFPHMAALGYLIKGQVQWLCSGSLISHYYVLTAAHCLRRNLGSVVAVSLGALQVTSMSVAAVKQLMEEAGVHSHIYPVAESLRHPEYKALQRYDDVALIRLSIPVRTFDLFVRPACLHADSSMDGVKTAVACGFGHTELGDDSLVKLQRHVNLSVYDPDVCSRVFSAAIQTTQLSRGIVNSQLCAGHLAGGKDTCNGDSGGPLQTWDKKDKCIIRIIGITSFGTALCGAKNTAAVYTSVAHYLSWIESVVWPSP